MTARTLTLALVMAPLAGCGTFEDDAQRGHDRTSGFDTPTAYTTADVRIITQRVHPVLHDTVVCTEPAPDVAKALATALQGGASGGNGTVNGSINFGAGSSEAVAELAGRSTALLGLRDGLFKACEAFANGALGADAYALVLSRYGQLMTTLFLGQDITGAAAAAGKANAQSPPITLPAPPAAGGGGAAQKPVAGAAATPTKQDTAATPAAPQAHMLLTALTQSATPIAAATPDVTPAPTDAAKGAATPVGGAQTAAATVGVQPAAAPGASAALALTRMNEDYISLDYDLTHTLLVLCVNESDPTRLQARETVSDANGRPLLTAANAPVERTVQNPWLMRLCNQVTEPAQIGRLQADSVQLLRQLPSVDPTGGARAAAPSPTASAAARPAAVAADPSVRAAQELLLGTHQTAFDPGAADGVLGARTESALRAFQRANPPLETTGKPDAATLAKLRRPAGA